MCQYKHIKGPVDEPTLLSNAHQRKEKGSSTHETEDLHNDREASCYSTAKKMCIYVSLQISELLPVHKQYNTVHTTEVSKEICGT